MIGPTLSTPITTRNGHQFSNIAYRGYSNDIIPENRARDKERQERSRWYRSMIRSTIFFSENSEDRLADFSAMARHPTGSVHI